MRIALVISSLNSGGAERVMSELANYWIKLGYEVSFFTLASPKITPFYNLDSKIKIQQLDQINLSHHSFFRRAFSIFKRIFFLRKALKNFHPDLIISFIDTINIMTILASTRLNIPVIVSERIDPTHHKIPHLYHWLRLKLYLKAKFLVVQTLNASNFFPESFRKFTHIIPNPVAKTTYIKKNINLPVQHLISVGRLNIQKDHKTLLFAFAELIFIHKQDIHLTIYGEGSERKNLEDLINKLGLQGKVSLPGVVSNIYQEISLGDIFIFPSLYEGFPNALCEAMSVGIPVIASHCSGNVDVVRDGIDGFLFPIGDISILVSKIITLIENEHIRRLFSQNALTVVERFNSQSILESWNQLVCNVR